MTGTGKKPPEKRPLRITLQKNVPRKKTPTEMLPTKEAPPPERSPLEKSQHIINLKFLN